MEYNNETFINQCWNSFNPNILSTIFEYIANIELDVDQTFKLRRELDVLTPREDYVNINSGSYVMLIVRNAIYCQWFYYKTIAGRCALINVFNGGQSAKNIILDDIQEINFTDFRCTLLPKQF